MDFITSAQVLLPALCGLGLTVFDADGGSDALHAFERRCAFAAQAQPLFTAAGLRRFFAKADPGRILLLRDALDIRAAAVKIGPRWLLLGPYAVDAWNESAARLMLAANALGEAALLPYKSYRCALPVLSEEYVIKIAALLLTNTVGNPPREVAAVDMAAQTAEDLAPRINEAYSDFTQVERRYAWEEELMDAVRGGHTARALDLYEHMDALMTGIRFLSDNIVDQIAGTCTLRALVRHAALQAGLTPVFVDALSQEYAQQMHRAAGTQQLTDLIHRYIAAFCRAVRDARKTDYSPHVRRAVQYIELHLSLPITVETLCALTGITRQRLGALFRKETGRTVKQYIAQRRCDCAAELLRGSRLQVQEIARYVGYEDVSYFARVFRAVTGQSPQAYRENASVW